MKILITKDRSEVVYKAALRTIEEGDVWLAPLPERMTLGLGVVVQVPRLHIVLTLKINDIINENKLPQ